MAAGATPMRILETRGGSFPRVVVFGGRAGVSRAMRGLADAPHPSNANWQRERLTAVVAANGADGPSDVPGYLLPATIDDVALEAEIDDGLGQAAGVGRHPHFRRLKVKGLARPVPELLKRIINADVIVVGPGSLYSAILPALLVGGVAATISGVNAVRIYVANLLTEPGETDGFGVTDYVEVIREHTGSALLFDYVLVNRRPPGPATLRACRNRGAEPIGPASCDDVGVEAVEWDLATVDEHGDIRHHATRLGRAILELARQGRPNASSHVRPGGREKFRSTATGPIPSGQAPITDHGNSQRGSHLREAVTGSNGSGARRGPAGDLPVEISSESALGPRHGLLIDDF